LTAAVMSVPAGPRRHHHLFAILIGGAGFGDRVDLRIALDMAEHGMADRRLAELAGHRDMLRMIKVLASEEHDLPFQESLADLIHLLRR
jgi:hypothetical protein